MRRVVLLFIVALGQVGLSQPISGPPEPQSPTTMPVPTPPPPPKPVSPLDFFRKLLAMSVPERAKILAAYSEQERMVLEHKIREYEAMPLERREARMQALQRQLDFRALIRLPASNRVERLAAMPQPNRQWLTERLQEWDGISPEWQRAVITNMSLLAYLFPDPDPLTIRSVSGPSSLPRPVRESLEKAIGQWNQMPDEKRQTILAHFKKFFQSNEKQQARTLEPLSPTERRQMQRCLELYGQMTRSQKERCLVGFQKFAELSREERQEFLQNAEQWQKMSAQDRQAWRELVSKYRPAAPPPIPGATFPPPLPPPRTGSIYRPQPISSLVSTNL